MAQVNSNQEIQKASQSAQPLDLWTHYASTGAADKNTMLSVESWLLGLSATMIGYIVTQLFKSDSFAFVQPWKVLSLAVPGAVIAFVAGYVALLYGGYANRNWARADDIATKCGWTMLVPDYSKDAQEPDGKNARHSETKVGYVTRFQMQSG